jgi:O6-methylguanine-DNA--protein-cysteine methyltransferase
LQVEDVQTDLDALTAGLKEDQRMELEKVRNDLISCSPQPTEMPLEERIEEWRVVIRDLKSLRRVSALTDESVSKLTLAQIAVDTIKSELPASTPSELALMAIIRVARKKLLARENAKDNPIDLDDVDEEDLGKRLAESAKSREEYSQMVSAAAPGASSEAGGSSVGEGKESKPDVKFNKAAINIAFVEKMTEKLRNKTSGEMASYKEYIERLNREKEQREREEEEKKARRKIKKMQREMELAEEKRKMAEKELEYVKERQQSMDLLKSLSKQIADMQAPIQPPPPVPVAPTPPHPSELQNVSGVSTTASASAKTAASGLRLLGIGEPANTSVSIAHDPDFDDLALSQFPFVLVPKSVHAPSVDDDDPYSLEVDLGDVEVSFTNLTQQYAPLQDDIDPALLVGRQEEQSPVDSPVKDDSEPAVGNPST